MTDPTPPKAPENMREVMRIEKDGTITIIPNATESDLREIITMLASAYHALRIKHMPAPDKVIDG